MDLSVIVPVERNVAITHPVTGEKTGLLISLVSIDDPKLKVIKRQIMNRKLKLDVKGKNFTADELDENSRDLVFQAVTGWSWGKNDKGDDASFEGEKPEFNRANFNRVMDKLAWVEKQIDEAVSDDKAFFPS